MTDRTFGSHLFGNLGWLVCPHLSSERASPRGSRQLGIAVSSTRSCPAGVFHRIRSGD